jgi:hypothetical protein
MDLGGAGFDGFEQISYKDKENRDAPKELTQSRKYARGGHGGAITEDHWGEIANFIVNGARPFQAEEPDCLFSPTQHHLLGRISAFRIGVPVLVLLALTTLVFSHGLWLPANSSGSLSPFFSPLAFGVWLIGLAVSAGVAAIARPPISRFGSFVAGLLIVLYALAALVWFATNATASPVGFWLLLAWLAIFAMFLALQFRTIGPLGQSASLWSSAMMLACVLIGLIGLGIVGSAKISAYADLAPGDPPSVTVLASLAAVTALLLAGFLRFIVVRV